MLENVNHRYGHGQQSYSMHHESFGMQHEYQNHVSGMQIMPGPCTDSPQYSRPLMFSGNYAEHEDGWHGKAKYQNYAEHEDGWHGKTKYQNYDEHEDGWHGKTMYQNGWNGQNMHQNGWSSTNVHYNHDSGGKFPPPGAFNGPPYSHSHMSNGMMVNAECETHNTMRVQATRFHHGSWDNNGFRCQSSNDWMPNGYQEVDEWRSLD